MTLLPPSPVSSPNATSLQPAPAPIANTFSPASAQAQASGGIDIWGPLQRRKYLIALFSIVGAVCGYFYYVNCPKVYSSNALLMITTQNPPSLIEANLRNDQESLDRHISLIASELVLNRAVDKGNLSGMQTFKGSTYPVGTLKEMLRVVPISKETLSIVCTGSEQDELPAILGEIISSYNSEIEKDSKDDGQKAKDLIQSFANKLSDDKEDAETERSNLWAQLGIESTDNQGNIINPHNKKLFRLQDQYDTVKREVKEVQDRALLLAKTLKINEKTGLVDETQVKISAIEAQEYLHLTRAMFEEGALGSERVVRSLQPEMQRRQAIQNKVWEQDTVLNTLEFERSKLSDVFGSGHKSISSLDKQIGFYNAQRSELAKELKTLDGYITAESNQLKSQLTPDESDEPIDLETFRADENREWIRMYQLKLQHEQSTVVEKYADAGRRDCRLLKKGPSSRSRDHKTKFVAESDRPKG